MHSTYDCVYVHNNLNLWQAKKMWDALSLHQSDIIPKYIQIAHVLCKSCWIGVILQIYGFKR